MYASFLISKLFGAVAYKIKDKEVLVVSHKDADGMISYAILNLVLKAKFYFVHTLTQEVLENISKEFDAYIFVDVGNNMEKEIFKHFPNKLVAILEHHRSNFDKVRASTNHYNLNSYLLGIDGEKEISSSGLCYLLSKSVNRYSFTGYYYLPFSGAFADMQIKGNNISGYNKFFMENALARGEIEIKKSLILPAISVKPLYKSIEYFFQDHGIEFTSYDAAHFLKKIGISPYKIENFRRVPIKASDLSYEEKVKLSTHLVMEIYEKGINPDDILRETCVIQKQYVSEEFVSMANAAVKLNRINDALDLLYYMKDISYVYDEYRKVIGKGFHLCKKEGKTKNNLFYYIFRDKKVLRDPSLTGTMASMLNNSLPNEVIFIGYFYDDKIKFSVRSKSLDVGNIVYEFCKSKKDCYGNGHKYAAGGVIPSSMVSELINALSK